MCGNGHSLGCNSRFVKTEIKNKMTLNKMTLLSLPCEIREQVDKKYINDWISLTLLEVLGDEYATVSFDLYYWLFNKKYSPNTINLAFVHDSLESVLCQYNIRGTTIVKELERRLLLNYLGEIGPMEKQETAKKLEYAISQLGQQESNNASVPLELCVVSTTQLTAMNRQKCYNYITNLLSQLLNGDEMIVVRLRVMSILYPDVPRDVDMIVLSQKLKNDLGVEAERFVASLQHFIMKGKYAYQVNKEYL